MNTPSENTKISTGTRHLSKRFILTAACLLIAAGYLLMTGSDNTEQSFNSDIFSTCRIIIAPMLCLSGYLLIIPGILYRK